VEAPYDDSVTYQFKLKGFEEMTSSVRFTGTQPVNKVSLLRPVANGQNAEAVPARIYQPPLYYPPESPQAWWLERVERARKVKSETDWLTERKKIKEEVTTILKNRYKGMRNSSAMSTVFSEIEKDLDKARSMPEQDYSLNKNKIDIITKLMANFGKAESLLQKENMPGMPPR
jgi:hypothetical protein